MAFGVYIHIPYCLQRCTYCDFATYEQTQIMPPEKYIPLLTQEINARAHFISTKKIDTIYFGGGTPSLISAHHIVTILQELSRAGFQISDKAEITIEINPATVSTEKLQIYLQNGINRFSVGAQTFSDPLLKSVHREHNAEQTKETLTLLKNAQVQFSLDLLFALPGQSLDLLKKDLEQILFFRPHHISPYCLTVPEGHVLSKNKLEEGLQLEMFQLISSALKSAGYHQYEISNFSLPQYESRHNSIYWDDEEYWGLGLSAHSYLKESPWGLRFWNPSSIGAYEKMILQQLDPKAMHIEDTLPNQHFEKLKLHQSVTDYCHISLRRKKGLLRDSFEEKFGSFTLTQIEPLLAQQVEAGLLNYNSAEKSWSLSDSGLLISNQVFSALTFLEGELKT